MVLHVLGLLGVATGADIVGGTGGEEAAGQAYDAIASAVGYIALVVGQVMAAFSRTQPDDAE